MVSGYQLRFGARFATVSSRLKRIAVAATKLTESKHISGASPKYSASGAVINGAVMLTTRPN